MTDVACHTSPEGETSTILTTGATLLGTSELAQRGPDDRLCGGGVRGAVPSLRLRLRRPGTAALPDRNLVAARPRLLLPQARAAALARPGRHGHGRTDLRVRAHR